MTRPRVLVVDDKSSNLKLFEEILAEKYQVATAESGERALAILEIDDFDVVVSDIRMPKTDGFELLAEVKARHPLVEVILMTAYGSIPKAVEAMKLGAYNYLTKPLDPDEVVLVVGQAVEKKRLKEKAENLGFESPARFSKMIGNSPAMERLFSLMDRAAGSEVTVLITGESGTGKELVARGIHEAGPRARGPFVAVNCGAIPDHLLESELFGHEKGAFTGADRQKAGLFEEAEGGSLFLDEVGELPLPLQVKLNRALQQRAIRRVGGAEERPVDVRVLAATNSDLQAQVKEGKFREDLYYRLNVFGIETPPLRDRRDDIPMLAAVFLERYRDQARHEVEGFTAEALGRMLQYDWPGNVRQLEHTVERALAVADGVRIGLPDLPDEVRRASDGSVRGAALTDLGFREAVELARDRTSRTYLTELMQTFGGNVTKAAEHAGMERESLHRLLKRYGIQPQDFRGSEP